MLKFQFKLVIWQSPAYFRIVKLRDNILRKPLGLALSDSDLKAEKDEFIFGFFIGSTPIASLQIKPLNTHKAKLRQMAVDSNYQGIGLGKQLIFQVEDFLKKSNFTSIELHARKSALGFYQKLGYKIISDEFIEVGIPHFKMNKEL